jgi:hypothetical protein
MNNGIKLLIASLAAGTISDLLFRDSIVRGAPNGLSVLCWSVSITLIATALLKSHLLHKKALLWLIPFNLACAAYMWRDSPVLHFIDIVVVFVSLTALSCSLRGFELSRAGVVDLLGAGLNLAIDCAAEAFPFLRHCANWKQALPCPVRVALPAVARGIAFSVPLLLLFGSLFVTADPAFAKLLSQSMNLNFCEFSSHLAFLGGFTWLTAGYLCPVMATSGGERFTISNAIARPSIGRLELNIVLAALNLLFFSFVLVQFHYFFGGSGPVAGLSYAEYARRGFFELTAVSALVLPVLLFIDWLLPRHCDKLDKVFPIQAAFQIILLFVIMLSASRRMGLYQDEFGLTELRFYTSAFIAWLGIIYFIFAGTVLVGKRQLFGYLTVLSGFLAATVVQLSNPDKIIMSVNIDRSQHGKTFDASYALALSNDATGYMVENIAKLPVAQQRTVAAALMNQHKNANHYDVRSFNIDRWRAYDAVDRSLPALSSLTAQPIAPAEQLISPHRL